MDYQEILFNYKYVKFQHSLWKIREGRRLIEAIYAYLEKNGDGKLSWFNISRSYLITMELIEEHPKIPWHWSGISANPNITMEYIESHMDLSKYQWDWFSVSYNPNLTLEFVTRYPRRNWCWYYISNRCEKEKIYLQIGDEKFLSSPNPYDEEVEFWKMKFAKEFYWKFVERAHLPDGFYYKKDEKEICKNG